MGGHKKLIHFLRADPAPGSALSSPRSFSSNDSSVSDDDGYNSSPSSFPASAASSPSRYSPPKSPWAATTHLPGLGADGSAATGLIASLVKEDGKVYSLAAAGDVLYTGTDSENVRVWRDRRELAGFRTGSGLVKAIVVAAGGRIFTGHQDGKVRVWRADAADPAVHRRVGSLPALGDYLVSSVNPSSYVALQAPRRRRRAVWLRHADAVSCLSLDEPAGLLYSGSWDRTFKVWRVSDSRCLESVPAHDDAVNTVAAAGFDGLVLTGSADGTVKVWRREQPAPGSGDRTRHVLERVLREGDGAVTAVAVCPEARAVYVGSSDGLVACWRWGLDGEPRLGGVLVGHRMAVMCLAVSGRVVVSGSADRTLCVWRRDDGPDDDRCRHARLAVLAGHTGPVKCVAVAAADDEGCYDGGERRFVVYSGSLDGSVKVWRLSEDRPLEPPPAVITEPATPSMPALLESEAWTPRRTVALAPPPELKRVAAA
ncbi:vegetative incompatibility protein HET-E-1 [Panicum miliaceum]|uniref:Vegetative incompatibility protein HET-E-1 n=1 Tax=Panicum miliaceum TaxID=4540 RepID=A0A3L6TT51_PANMI|nr:vegetative incompatibility protein HET-E-1 [Panicum miliaceum]